MRLWQLAVLWLGSWVIILMLGIINHCFQDKEAIYITENIENELVSDGNNLFSTGLIYFIGNLICHFIKLPILHWVLFIAGVVFCIIPIISLIGMLFTVFKLDKKYMLSFLSAILCDITPLIMALNIYTVYIK